MEDDGRIKIETRLNLGYSSNVKRGEEEFSVVTEKVGTDETVIVTTIYLKGSAVCQRKLDLGKKADPMDLAHIEPIARKHHYDALAVVESGKDFAVEQADKSRRPRDYIDEAKNHLVKKNHSRALAVLREGFELYPEDPFILSYYGCLSAIVDKKFKTGIDACTRSLNKLAQKFPVGLDASVRPALYLNLCRAYLAAGDKKSAVDTLYRGMKYDKDTGMLHQELVKLGIRRKPIFPFLKRSNPVNKYIGLLLNRMGKPEQNPKPEHKSGKYPRI